MSGAFGKAIAAGAAVVAMGLAFGAAAQQTVKIGAVYPLSGNLRRPRTLFCYSIPEVSPWFGRFRRYS